MRTPLVFELTCSPEQAFSGFTDGSEIIRWWGDPAVYRTISWKSDLRDGGAWRAEFEAPNGSRFGAGGTYVVIDRPSGLEWTWTADWEPQVEKTISMTFLPTTNGTAMTVATKGNLSEDSEQVDEAAWKAIVGWFERDVLDAR